MAACLTTACLSTAFLGGAGFAEPAPVPVSDPFEAELGRALFEKLWVAAPSSTRGSDGLGPLYNARACSNCHEGGGGAVLPASAGQEWEGPSGFGLVAKFMGHSGGGHPQFGVQLQDRAITGAVGAGFGPEGALALRYAVREVALSGGERAALRHVMPVITGSAAGEAVSLRIAPRLAGAHLIAGINAAEIAARADPEDADSDGISGRISRAYSPELGREALARFGWRAEAVTLKDQTALAFFTDMGLSSPLYPDPAGDCLSCVGMPTGEDAGLRDGREVSTSTLDLVVAYLAALTPQAPPTGTSRVISRGATLFAQAGCGGCHVTQYSTGAAPYSDFLLHDMGPDLADGGGAEWRTAPLWGAETGARRGYLHDGRARTALEAVLWHGGEAQGARDKVTEMAVQDRAALLEFLESL